jgi:hypothetical protein
MRAPLPRTGRGNQGSRRHGPEVRLGPFDSTSLKSTWPTLSTCARKSSMTNSHSVGRVGDERVGGRNEADRIPSCWLGQIAADRGRRQFLLTDCPGRGHVRRGVRNANRTVPAVAVFLLGRGGLGRRPVGPAPCLRADRPVRPRIGTTQPMPRPTPVDEPERALARGSEVGLTRVHHAFQHHLTGPGRDSKGRRHPCAACAVKVTFGLLVYDLRPQA